jgi:hypothetical protein
MVNSTSVNIVQDSSLKRLRLQDVGMRIFLNERTFRRS